MNKQARMLEIERDLESIKTLPARLMAEGCKGERLRNRLAVALNCKVRLVREYEMLKQPEPAEPIICTAPLPTVVVEPACLPSMLAVVREEAKDMVIVSEYLLTFIEVKDGKKGPRVSKKKVETLRKQVLLAKQLEQDAKESLAGAALHIRLGALASMREEAELALLNMGMPVYEKEEKKEGWFGLPELTGVLAKALNVEVPFPKHPDFNEQIRAMWKTGMGMRVLFAAGCYYKPCRKGDFKGETLDCGSLYFGRRFRVFMRGTQTHTNEWVNVVRYDTLNASGKSRMTVQRHEVVKDSHKIETGETTPGSVWRGVKVTATWRWDGEMWHPAVVCRNISSTVTFDGENRFLNLDTNIRPCVWGYDESIVPRWSGEKHEVQCGDEKEIVGGTTYHRRSSLVSISITNLPEFKPMQGALPKEERIRIVGEYEPEKVTPHDEQCDVEVAAMFKGLGGVGSAHNRALHHSREKKQKKVAARIEESLAYKAFMETPIKKATKEEMEAYRLRVRTR